MKRRAFLSIALVLAMTAGALATPTAQQLLRWTDLCAAVTATTFAWSGGTPAACTGTPNKIVLWTDFTTNVTHAGSCGAGNPLPVYSAMITCKGSGSTFVTDTMSGAGRSFSSSANPSPPPNFLCTSAGGPLTQTYVMPAETKAPVNAGTQLSWTPSSVAKIGGSSTGTGVSLSLYNPSSVLVLGPNAIANGTVVATTYSSPGAPAGAWYWQVTSLGSQSCSSSSGTVTAGNPEQFTATVGWYQ